MRIKGRVYIDCGSGEKAKVVANAVKPENENYIKMKIEGKYIVAEAMAENPLSLLHTLDDFLNCVGLAMKTITNLGKEF